MSVPDDGHWNWASGTKNFPPNCFEKPSLLLLKPALKSPILQLHSETYKFHDA